MRDYLAVHPHADNPAALPAMRLDTPRPTGLRATDSDGKPANKDRRTAAQRQADTLARLTVVEAQARLVLDWSEPLRHATFYKAVYRPAVLRAMRQTPRAGLSAALKFHSLRHTYASLCASTDIATVKPV